MAFLDLPLFTGENPVGWVSDTEEIFDLNSVPVSQRLTLVQPCWEGNPTVIRWYNHLTETPDYVDWQKFCDMAVYRFGTIEEGDELEMRREAEALNAKKGGDIEAGNAQIDSPVAISVNSPMKVSSDGVLESHLVEQSPAVIFGDVSHTSILLETIPVKHDFAFLVRHEVYVESVELIEFLGKVCADSENIIGTLELLENGDSVKNSECIACFDPGICQKSSRGSAPSKKLLNGHDSVKKYQETYGHFNGWREELKYSAYNEDIGTMMDGIFAEHAKWILVLVHYVRINDNESQAVEPDMLYSPKSSAYSWQGLNDGILEMNEDTLGEIKFRDGLMKLLKEIDKDYMAGCASYEILHFEEGIGFLAKNSGTCWRTGAHNSRDSNEKDTKSWLRAWKLIGGGKSSGNLLLRNNALLWKNMREHWEEIYLWPKRTWLASEEKNKLGEKAAKTSQKNACPVHDFSVHHPPYFEAQELLVAGAECWLFLEAVGLELIDEQLVYAISEHKHSCDLHESDYSKGSSNGGTQDTNCSTCELKEGGLPGSMVCVGITLDGDQMSTSLDFKFKENGISDVKVENVGICVVESSRTVKLNDELLDSDFEQKSHCDVQLVKVFDPGILSSLMECIEGVNGLELLGIRESFKGTENSDYRNCLGWRWNGFTDEASRPIETNFGNSCDKRNQKIEMLLIPQEIIKKFLVEWKRRATSYVNEQDSSGDQQITGPLLNILSFEQEYKMAASFVINQSSCVLQITDSTQNMPRTCIDVHLEKNNELKLEVWEQALKFAQVQLKWKAAAIHYQKILTEFSQEIANGERNVCEASNSGIFKNGTGLNSRSMKSLLATSFEGGTVMLGELKFMCSVYDEDATKYWKSTLTLVSQFLGSQRIFMLLQFVWSIRGNFEPGKFSLSRIMSWEISEMLALFCTVLEALLVLSLHMCNLYLILGCSKSTFVGAAENINTEEWHLFYHSTIMLDRALVKKTFQALEAYQQISISSENLPRSWDEKATIFRGRTVPIKMLRKHSKHWRLTNRSVFHPKIFQGLGMKRPPFRGRTVPIKMIRLLQFDKRFCVGFGTCFRVQVAVLDA